VASNRHSGDRSAGEKKRPEEKTKGARLQGDAAATKTGRETGRRDAGATTTTKKNRPPKGGRYKGIRDTDRKIEREPRVTNHESPVTSHESRVTA
jgi:hypothetical protein